MQPDLYRNRFKGISMRLSQRDYRRPGGYFVTLCTKHREHFFGDVIDGRMQLSTIGHVAERCWREIPDHCKDAQIDEYVVMPNHVHGILVIDHRLDDGEIGDVADVGVGDVGGVDDAFVGTFHGTSLQNRPADGEDSLRDYPRPAGGENSPREISSKSHRKLLPPHKPFSLSQTMSAISPKRGSLSTIIRSCKSSVTRWCRQNGYSHFAWQPRFYEHIIRADGSIDYIRRYIVNNPRNWQRDRNNVRKLSPPTAPPTITSPSPPTSL